MNKVWHHYEKWECFINGMWGASNKKNTLLREAIVFTGDAKLYGFFMRRVINEWPITCEQHLTDINSNRKAWLGHAACSLAIKCPEDITRQAWGYLSQDQQDSANLEAERTIAIWETKYASKN